MKQAKLLLVLGAANFAFAAQAQSEIPALVEKNRVETQTLKVIQIRNVTPSVIAHWLDAKQFSPSSLEQRSLVSWTGSGYSKEDAPQLKSPVPAALPDGVRITKVADDQNTLVIAGSETAVQQAEALIRQLDLPFKQVEIECQLVRVDEALLKAARFPFAPIGKTLAGGILQQAKPERNVPLTLNNWTNNAKTQILMAPRVVAIMDLAGSIRTETITSGSFVIESGSIAKDGLPSVQQFDHINTPSERMPRFISSYGMTIVPQIIEQRSVQARVQLGRNLLLGFYKPLPVSESEKADLEMRSKNGKLSAEEQEKLTSLVLGIEKYRHFLRATDGFDEVITLQDGETTVLTGFTEDLMWGKPTSTEEALKRQGTTLVAFVTFRIIHRLDEMASVPGT